MEKPLTEFNRHCNHKDGYAYNCKPCHLLSVNESRMKDPEKYKEKLRQYYKKKYQDPATRKKILEKNSVYNKTHRAKILIQARKRRFKKLGKPLTPKPFVFYRDVIVHWMNAGDQSASKWKELLSLPLTSKQIELVNMAIKGIGVAEAAIILKKQQSTITKTWNGSPNHKNGISYGGIMGKVKKFAPHLLGDDHANDKKVPIPQKEKRHSFEQTMMVYFPPNKFPQLWCNEECKMTDVNTTKQGALLLEYKKLLDDKILALRAEARELAAKSREISKLIPAEQIQEVAEQAEADEAWSLEGVIDLMKKAN